MRFIRHTINFQNLGNGSATRVVVLDTLDSKLEPSTFRYLHSSHEEFLSIRKVNGNIVQFIFEGITLEPAEVDSAASKGYINYKVSVNPEQYAEGIVIENSASIYFDFNPPIKTNTTTNLLYSDLNNDGFYSIDDCNDEDASINPNAIEIADNGVDEDCDGVDLTTSITELDGYILSIYPNPTQDLLNIEYNTNENIVIEIYSSNGRLVSTNITDDKSTTIDMRQLHTGVYLLKTKSIKTGNSVIQKVIKL